MSQFQVGQEIEVVGPPDLMHGLDASYYGKYTIKAVVPVNCGGFQRDHITFVKGRFDFTVDDAACRLANAGTMTGRLVSTSSNEGIIEQAIALPDADRQRLYKLLYNSGCRINR